jgi:hypothetical protein
VTVFALFDTACPSAFEIGHDPASATRRGVEPEMWPSLAPPRMFDYPPPLASSVQRCGKAAVVIAFDLPLAGSFDVQRLPCP